MVFETLISDILNRFLGDYIENLNATQLKVGILKGDVELRNLKINQNVLDDFELPVRLYMGSMNSLVLRIPWQNLYQEPVIAEFDGLYLLLVPNQGVVYNKEKAEERELNNKKKVLARIEAKYKAKQMAKLKDVPKDDTFTERLIGQIIKNLQVKIRKIHVRFEDQYTNRARPFAAGITLESLNFQTTDENWIPNIRVEMVNLIHKLVSLKSLAFYWNCNSDQLFSTYKSQERILQDMETSIAKKKDYNYVLEPISMTSKLILNRKPESDRSDWAIPKIYLDIVLESLALRIEHHQYQDVCLFLDAMERLNLGWPHRKFRPNLQEYKGNYKDWWLFAYKCILEDVRRRQKNWSWSEMEKHRKLVKNYQRAWISKQTERNPYPGVLKTLKDGEIKLDLFNLNIARQQAEMEIVRRGLTKVEDQPQGWLEWGKNWLRQTLLPAGPDRFSTPEDIISELETQLTGDEKRKLYEAIDYQQHIPPTDYPKHYVENQIEMCLNSLSIQVEDALKFEIFAFGANFHQRPSAQAFHIKAVMKALTMVGQQPMLTMLEADSEFLAMEYEKNPLHQQFDQSICLTVSSFLFKHHTPSVLKAIEVFRLPKSVGSFNQLTTAANTHYENFKKQGITNIQNAVDVKNHNKFVLEAKFNPITLVISSDESDDQRKPDLIAELGYLSFNGAVDNRSHGARSQEFTVYIGEVTLRISPTAALLLQAINGWVAEYNDKPMDKTIHEPTLKEFKNYWTKKPVKKDEYWWFKSVADAPNENFTLELDILRKPEQEEKAFLSIKKFAIIVESVRDILPLVYVESSFNAFAQDWSGCLNADVSLQLQASYYNEKLNVWEPLIEPVVTKTDEWKTWKLTAKVRTHSEEEGNSTIDGGGFLPPKMTVNIESKDMVNITCTRSFMLLLYKLLDEYSKAAQHTLTRSMMDLTTRNAPAYTILNNTGLALALHTTPSLQFDGPSKHHELEHGKKTQCRTKGWKPSLGIQANERIRKAELDVEILGIHHCIDVLRSEIRCIRLEAVQNKSRTVIVETRIENLRHEVSLKSMVEFVNYTHHPIRIYAQKVETELNFCGIADIDHQPLNIPLPLLYTKSGLFYIKPDGNYEISDDPINWTSFSDDFRSTIRILGSTDTTRSISFELVIETKDVLGPVGSRVLDRLFIVRIYPTLLFKNLLPFSIEINNSNPISLDGGDEVKLYSSKGNEFDCIVTYLGKSYRGKIKIPNEAKSDDLDIVKFTQINDLTQNIRLGAHWSTRNKQQECSIYAPYWVVNNTGKTLFYLEKNFRKSVSKCCRVKTNDVTTHEHDVNPILLALSDRNFNSKKKAKLRLEYTKWSEDFPLDAVGSSGRIITRDENDREYEITVDVQVTQTGLTKILTFSPFYIIQNDSKFSMEYKENVDNLWHLVVPGESVGLWPVSKKKRKFLAVRYYGKTGESQHFPFTENFESFCAMDSRVCGVYVQVSVGEWASVVHVEEFSPGMAPAIIINATQLSLGFGQKGTNIKEILNPWETCAFKWPDVSVAAHLKLLEWNCGGYTAEDSLHRNEYGSFLPNSLQHHHYWVSFLSGRQRYFLLTDDLAVMTVAYEAYELERIDLQTDVRISGIGLSLVNNIEGREIIFASITNSGAAWEIKQKNKFEELPADQVQKLEHGYQEWLKDEHKTAGFRIIDEKIGVDYANMIIRKSSGPEVTVRRTFHDGLWFHYSQSAHQTRIHLKINDIQMDNQLPACSFHCLLSVVPPPDSTDVKKPFIELSCNMRQSEHSHVLQINYLHILIQEFAIRLDQVLINEFVTLFSADETSYTKEQFLKDMELIHSRLSQKVLIAKAKFQSSFYDDLQISPLMIHLSYSQGRSPKKGKSQHGSEFANLILKSVGVTITELQDVIFRLAFFERKSVFYNWNQLMSEIQWHYTQQFIKQLYVLVLGLDIIGNPFGLIRDLQSGFQGLFYEPYKGAIQGPEEFAEGLALGVKGLFTHTVGGTAGAVSRITGTLGKGLAALTLDDEYQRKRQEALNRRPTNVTEGMAQSARGLGQSVIGGISGIITKPLEGAQREGVSGFAKGVGHGIVGVVTRPVSGVVDFASSTMNVIKMVTGNEEQTKSLRPMRLIRRDKIVRPYSIVDAIGAKIFSDLDQGKYRDSDHYVCHEFTSDKNVVIVTDRRVLLTHKRDIMGVWVTDETLSYDEIKPPQQKDLIIKLELKQKKSGFLGIGKDKGKEIRFKEREVCERIYKSMIRAFEESRAN